MEKSFIILISVLCLYLTACNDGGKFGQYADKDIAREYKRCLADPHPSRTQGIICGNYERECKRRKSKGNNICALQE